jgi:hypothetical protein
VILVISVHRHIVHPYNACSYQIMMMSHVRVQKAQCNGSVITNSEQVLFVPIFFCASSPFKIIYILVQTRIKIIYYAKSVVITRTHSGHAFAFAISVQLDVFLQFSFLLLELSDWTPSSYPTVHINLYIKVYYYGKLV